MAGGLAGKAGKAYRAVRHELLATRELRRAVGIRRAVAQRGRVNLELETLPAAVEAARAAAADAAARAAAAERRAAGAVAAAATLADRLAALRAEADDLRALLAGATWAGSAPRSQTLVSVLMATRDRAGLLPEAIASVLAQTHRELELVVVDDGSLDDTAAVVGAIEDPRVRLVSLPREDHGGPNVALNAGLRAARGAVIAYLDDDNVMQPSWLATVAAALDRRPDVDVVYGARVFDPLDGRMPAVQWERWDPATLERFNFMDQNVIAHRAGLPEAVLDEDLPHAGDWDLALRLTAAKAPLRLPAVAVAYRSHADGRQSDHPAARRSYELVQVKLHARRALTAR